MVNGDIIDLRDFRLSGSFVESLNSTFLVLIQRIEGTTNIEDLRPIVWWDVFINLLHKILKRRMTKVARRVVRECQYAFVGEDKL